MKTILLILCCCPVVTQLRQSERQQSLDGIRTELQIQNMQRRDEQRQDELKPLTDSIRNFGDAMIEARLMRLRTDQANREAAEMRRETEALSAERPAAVVHDTVLQDAQAELLRAKRIEQAVNQWEVKVRKRDPGFGELTDVKHPYHGDSAADKVFDRLLKFRDENPLATPDEFVGLADRAYHVAKIVIAIADWEKGIRKTDSNYGDATILSDPKHGQSTADKVMDAIQKHRIEHRDPPNATPAEFVAVAQAAYNSTKAASPSQPPSEPFGFVPDAPQR